MKNVMKRSFAVLMTLVMCASMLFGLTFSTQAATENTVNYVYSGDYVYNWGKRGTTAEFLSPMAIEFYSAKGTTLDELLALNGSATESGVPSSALFGELHELMESNHDYITSYNATKELFQYTDCQNSGGSISSFYSGTAIGPSWDGGWNREHVWPNSKGDAAGNGENDLMMLRPTSTSENSSRGNKAYGTSTTTEYYNPNQEGGGAYDLRGDCARIILYQYVRWECTNTGSGYNSTGIFGADGVIESKDVLLDWIETDPVDTWEMGRNDAAESILGTRNVFVDYPELAFDLFNESVPTDYTSPSGGVSVEGDTSGSTGDNTGDDTTGDDVTIATTATITFDSTAKRTAYSTSQQIWTENDIVVTNNKSSSTTNVADYAKPARFYKSSELIIEYPSNITKIEFTANSSSYATALKSSISGSSASGSVVTVELDTPAKSFTAILSGGQVRMDSITVYAEAASNDNTTDDKVYVDSNGVIVSGSADAFPEDTTITVTPITSGDAFDTATSALDGIASKFTAYDVTPSATLNEGAVVTLTLPLPDGYDEANVRVVHVPEDGIIDLENDVLYPSVDKIAKTVSVEVSHFSTYAVVDTSEASTEGGEGTTTTEIVFEFGANGTATHKDGSTDKATYTETVNGYTLSLTGGSKCYPSSYDAKGNSAIKLGTGSADGSFSMTAPDEVTSVIFMVAQYKTNATVIDINGTQYTITTSSDVGAYTPITIDTTETKTITFKSTGSKHRCMIDSITYVIAGSSGGETPETPTYTYTAVSNNESYGKVTQDGNTITATAEDGYRISEAVVTPEGAATVTNNNDGTFTVSNLTADAQITINFEQIPTYTVQFIENINENSVVTSTSTRYEGEQIILPEHDSTEVPEGYGFLGWATVENATTDIKAAGSTYAVSSDVTFYAQYKEQSDLPITSATITFDNTSKRIVGTTSQQKWVENGITVTNDKAASSTNINTNYFDPIRVYASSSLTIEYPGMTKIEITANSDSYATVVANSISDSNAIVTTNEKVVTITLATAVDCFVINKLSAQTRLNSITVYATESAEPSNQYTVTYIENGEETGSLTLPEGTEIILPNATNVPSDKEFAGWATVENATTSDILAAGTSYTVTLDVTFYAQYTDKIVETATHNFVKVTEDQTDWSGTYLIVYEAGSIAFNGALDTDGTLDGTGNYVDVTITDSIIPATNTLLQSVVTVEKTDGGYTIKTASGLYIGNDSTSNDLSTSTSNKRVNVIAFDSATSVVTIKGTKNYSLQFYDSGSGSRFRYYGSTQQPIALYKLDIANISGAQVMVGADLSMDYYVDITNVENVSGLSIRFTVGGDETSTTVALDKSKTAVIDGVTYYVFTFGGLAPQRMTDNIKAELLLGETVVDILAQYSVQQNAINLLADNPSDALTRFITDMLYYGKEAQIYRGHNTDKLATDGVEGIGTASTAAPTTTDLTLSEKTGTANFKSATVWFDAANSLVVKVNNPEDVAVKVCVKIGDGEETELIYDEKVGGYKTDGIKATDFGTVYTFTLYEGDSAVQTLTYSINAYAFSKQSSSNENMANLALALYRYGLSASEYAATL